ncbi:hypothetical protein HDU87_005778 [Geranomyces variabilis]|uniref:Chitin-binding type-4 domain-containing protein n=1 Tax=Geranomyces variabilis TaxID=109894 RepID=A0AAD5TLT6_9FUNG|nr:hypothetical protein HDU87_005778 [Geranomyces variabilis]
MKVTSSLSAAAAALLLASSSSVSAHGFLSGIGTLSSSQRGQVRDYNKINVQIDDLRNPLAGNSQLCRGAAKGPVVPLDLSSGSLTLTQAFSLGAQHIGPCAVEIIDANDHNNKVTIASANGLDGCARPPIAQFDTDKLSPATNQCHGKIPAGLVTNDMCLQYWTFQTQNVDKITCTDCILRWTWSGEHISVTNPEKYENCIDVKVTKNGSTPPPVDVPNPDTNTNTNIPPVVVTPPKQNPAPTQAPPAKPAPTHAPAAPAPAPTPATPASSGSCADNFMACNGQGFLVCFPGQAGRAPVPMSCAQGTKCKQFGKYIQCA